MTSSTQFGEIFELEMYAWYKSLENYPGEMFEDLMHAIIRDLGESFMDSIKHQYAFNILRLADDFAAAGKYKVSVKQVCFYMLAQFPHPKELSEDQQMTMAEIIDMAEQEYGGAIERLEKKWKLESRETLAA